MRRTWLLLLVTACGARTSGGAGIAPSAEPIATAAPNAVGADYPAQAPLIGMPPSRSGAIPPTPPKPSPHHEPLGL